MTGVELVGTSGATPAGNDWRTVLTYLGLPPDDPATHALVLLCERYGLDPLLGHARIIGQRGAFVPYITRDGMIEVAHRSGQLDGIVVDEQRRNSTGDGFTAFVSVWRKDMSHPFRYGAQCKDTESQARAGNGPEMAVARAERRSLKRAFRIPTVLELLGHGPVDIGDEPDAGDLRAVVDVPAIPGVEPVQSTVAASVPVAGSARVTDPGSSARPDQAAAHAAIGALDADTRAVWLEGWGITDFSAVWPDDAARDALAGDEPGAAL